MNKDLDERLVPNGEYRDALNIQIATSDGSEVGSVQSIPSNKPWLLSSDFQERLQDEYLTPSQTVGVYNDNENNHIYNFVCDSLNFTPRPVLLEDRTTINLRLGKRADTIYRVTPDKNLPDRSTYDIVIHDIYEVRMRPRNGTAANEHSFNDIFIPSSHTTFTLQQTNSQNIYQRARDIRPGMRVQAINATGDDVYGLNNEVIVKSISTFNGGYKIRTTGVNGTIAGLYTQDMHDQGVYLKFTAPRILKFRKGDSLELELNNASPLDTSGSYIEPEYFPKAIDDTRSKIPKPTGNTTYTPRNSYISAINVIDNYLMWTDGRNEPKKINIDRCIKGNDNREDNSTINLRGQHHTMLVVESNKRTFGVGYLKESHITTLKPNPCNSLKAEALNSSPSSHSNVPIFGKNAGSDQQFGPWSLHDNSNNFYTSTDSIWIKPAVEGVAFNVGDILTLTGQQSSSQVQVQIDSYNSSAEYYVVNLITEPPEGYTVEAPDEIWTAFVKPNDGLYNQDFVSFSYRYIYSDGEVSCLAPFTYAVFAAGDYAYSSKNGFNLGMQNNIEAIALSDYQSASVPLDVVSLEFVFKSQKSDNVYSFKTIDIRFNPISNYQLNNLEIIFPLVSFLNTGYVIQEKLFGYTIPSDQLTRIFDAVPKKAIAQEVQANRLMYANYTQDYDLLDARGNYVTPSVRTKVISSSTGFGASFSSPNILTAMNGSYNVVNTNPDTSEDDPFVTQTDEDDYDLGVQSQGPQQLYTSTAIQMGVENDPGDNWNGTVYTAPVTGEYIISAKVSVSGTFKQTLIVGGAFDENIIPRNLRLAIYNANNQVAVQGEPLYSTFYSTAQSVEFDVENDNPNDPREILFETTINLNQGAPIALFVQSNHIGDTNSPSNIIIHSSEFNVLAAPSNQFDLPALRGQKSIKSERNYNVGIVYRDELGRESSVLIGDDEDFNCKKELAPFSNYLSFTIQNQAPQWAKTYKLFIKENTSKYSNLVLESAFLSAPTEGDYVYLVFNSLDINKVKIGDYLVAKKQQGTSVAITDVDAKFRIISIIGDAEFNDEGQALTVGNTAVPNAIIATADQLDGKFFVKVFSEGIQGPDAVLGVFESDNDDEVAIISSGNNNGAVFEVEPDSTLDLDLYYEISNALPVRLDNDYVDKYLRRGYHVSISNELNSSFGVFSNANYQQLPRVHSVRGAMTSGLLQNQHNNQYAYCQIRLAQSADVYVDTNYQNTNIPDTVVTFYASNREFYQAYLARPIEVGDNVIYVLPNVHGRDLSVAPGFYNCISFGNGVESDTIRDDFNAAELLKYTATGKQSGVKASMPTKSYEEYTRSSDIIFSEIYNESVGSNRFNEFLVAKNIIKQINPDYGSIQKLFSRDNDLLTLCEKKCLKVLSKKDALFNADGNQQLLSTDKVLGQAIPFAGDYGISKNPESFASDEYRCYFTDASRGAVIRLSKDGITPISKAGMDDWFSDHLVNTAAAIGSFDGNKEEYNITLHEIAQPGVSKLVYTVSFSEVVDGWTSFKSFIQDAGLTINNKYYTFKTGLPWRHDVPDISKVLISSALPNSYFSRLLAREEVFNTLIQERKPPVYNNFYGVQYLSEITTLFNNNSEIVKTFRYFNYEGSQARVLEKTNFESLDSLNIRYIEQYSLDAEYYSLYPKDGWYCEYINTDIQESGRAYFVEKEGKWFGYVKGAQTKHKNKIDGGTILDTNIDTKEHNIQGLGNMTSDVTLISGTLPSSGHNVYITTNFDYASQETSDGQSIFGQGAGGGSGGSTSGGSGY